MKAHIPFNIPSNLLISIDPLQTAFMTFPVSSLWQAFDYTTILHNMAVFYIPKKCNNIGISQLHVLLY